MQKVIFGIFAHPDDEAFGCGGTLLMETQSGTELHLVTLTLGDAGMNPDNHDDLAVVREQEWRRSGELMGATDMHYLGYKDGQLCNLTMIEAGKKIVELVSRTLETADTDTEIEFMTIDLNGITGHIDHIVAARAASWAFYTLKARNSRLTRIRYVCVPESQFSAPNVDWIYMEPGHAMSHIDETVDARQYRNTILEIIRAHHTQRGDGEAIIARQGDELGISHFIVKK